MSFQAYIDNIKAKTGKGPEDFKSLAEKKGFLKNGQLKPEVKAGEIVAWLKEDFDLGHGHAMAIVAVFKPQILTLQCIISITRKTVLKAMEQTIFGLGLRCKFYS
jgi:hypothetical protein